MLIIAGTKRIPNVCPFVFIIKYIFNLSTKSIVPYNVELVLLAKVEKCTTLFKKKLDKHVENEAHCCTLIDDVVLFRKYYFQKLIKV